MFDHSKVLWTLQYWSYTTRPDQLPQVALVMLQWFRNCGVRLPVTTQSKKSLHRKELLRDRLAWFKETLDLIKRKENVAPVQQQSRTELNLHPTWLAMSRGERRGKEAELGKFVSPRFPLVSSDRSSVRHSVQLNVQLFRFWAFMPILIDF